MPVGRQPAFPSLWESASALPLDGRVLRAHDATIALADLTHGSTLGGQLGELHGRSVLLLTSNQLAAAVALTEIDGIARRIVLCPLDLDLAHIPYIVATAGVDAIVTDRPIEQTGTADVECVVMCEPRIDRMTVPIDRAAIYETEWILFTSGTTGLPKMVVHTLATLTGGIRQSSQLAGPVIWATYYDIRRYGGLQILLRALLGGGSLVLSSPDEAVGDFLGRVREHGATHITGTPSHWRRALMHPSARALSPRYARLSGEIADDAILEHMRAAFPQAKVAHAFASTEAGVAFEVTDGRAGFLTAFCQAGATAAVQLRVDEGTLRIRSNRTALRYLGNTTESLRDSQGFVDTGDVVEERGGRYYFVGRRGGIINVGGLKIHPEEVEAVINRHPHVRMSLVKARRSPITGAVVSADVVLTSTTDVSTECVKSEIFDACRGALAAHKVPAAIRFVPSLEVTPSGKLVRRHA